MQSKRRRLTRGAVVDAAAELLDEQQGREVTLAQVAGRLGVRTPSLYNHVNGLEELRQDIAVAGARELAERIGQSAIGRSGEDALREIAWAYRSFAKERPGLYLATQRAPEPGQTELAEVAEGILRVLRVVMGPFGLSDEEQVHAIRALRSMVHGFVSLELNGGFGMPVDLDASFDYLVRMYIREVASGCG